MMEQAERFAGINAAPGHQGAGSAPVSRDYGAP